MVARQPWRVALEQDGRTISVAGHARPRARGALRWLRDRADCLHAQAGWVERRVSSAEARYRLADGDPEAHSGWRSRVVCVARVLAELRSRARRGARRALAPTVHVGRGNRLCVARVNLVRMTSADAVRVRLTRLTGC